MTRDIRDDIISAVDHFGPVSLEFYRQLTRQELTENERKYVVSKLDNATLEAVVNQTVLNCDRDLRNARSVAYADFLENVLVPELLRRLKEYANHGNRT